MNAMVWQRGFLADFDASVTLGMLDGDGMISSYFMKVSHSLVH